MNNLDIIKEEITRYYNKSRDEVFTTCITNRLNTTLKNYNLEMDLTSDYLANQESVRVLKAFTKIQKAKDKEVIRKNSEEN